MTPEELDRAVGKGEIAPLYFMFGEEEFLLERAVQRLVDRAVPPESRDFNYTVYYGKECRAEQIIDTANTLPMFAQRRVILVKRAEELSAEVLERLLSYIAAPSPDCCLIFQAAKIDQRRKFFSELKKGNALIEFKKVKDEQLPGIARREASNKGKRIDTAAAELLVYYVGNNLRELVAQIEKLAVYVGTRELIAVDDVRKIVSDTKVDTVFELANALGQRKIDQALRQLQILQRDSDAPYLLVGALARHFRQLCLIRELHDRKVSAEDIGRRLKINPYFFRGMHVQALKFESGEFVKIFILLHDTDIALKSGGRQSALLEQLLYGICMK